MIIRLFLFVILLGANALLIPHDSDVTVGQLSIAELEYLSDDPVVTHTVKFTISKRVTGEGYEVANTAKIGDITLGLFGTVAPLTVHNFVYLANMTFGYGYQDVLFHRIIKDFVIQGGDFENKDGTGGHSIYEGGKFPDENFVMKHNKKGRLSMANAGANTNGAQFFITTVPELKSLDGRHVVFGQVIGGMDTLETLNKASTDTVDRPLNDLYVSHIKVTDFKVDPNTDQNLHYAPSSVLNKPPKMFADEEEEDFIPESTPLFGWYKLFFFTCLITIALMATKNHYRKQYIADIKDTDYF